MKAAKNYLSSIFHLHVVLEAVPPLLGAEVVSGGGGDEVVAAARQELHRVRLGRERAEADGEHAARIDINIEEI